MTNLDVIEARTRVITPSDFNLPHESFREHQLESILWCLGLEGFGCMEAPTGSGKTSCPAAVSTKKSVIALCRTKNLQAKNYGETYGFTVLYGRGNYPCVNPDNPDATGEDCLFPGRMHACPDSKDCPYLLQKTLAQTSLKTSLNYPYFLTSKWPKESPSCLFLDEAHNLSDVVLDWAGCTVTEKQRKDWDLPDFPIITHRAPNRLLRLGPPSDEAQSWILKSLAALKKHEEKLQAQKIFKQALKKCRRLSMKLDACQKALTLRQDDWYIRSGPAGLDYGKKTQPGFVARPLTARYHFPEYFLRNRSTIAMSATIGDVGVFSEELGLESCCSKVVPCRFPSETRPVLVLDAPNMGQKATESDFEHQADVIAQAIRSCNPGWSGLIHVTRKSEAKLLAERLAYRGLQNRVWITPGWDGNYAPTDDQLQAWEERKRKVPNSLCVSWAFMEGFDGLDEKICISAKVPFGYLGDPYEKERMYYSGRMYRQRAAWLLEQSLGRTRRGREEDYDTDSEKRGFVAIADGCWVQVRNYLSQALREAITMS